MKKVLVISSSPRKGGNSDLLCDEFIRGASDVGNEVEKIRLAEKNVGFCKACYACQKLGKCFQNDDANEIIEKMLSADVIVLATPVYFYSMDAQLKALEQCICEKAGAPFNINSPKQLGEVLFER